MTRLSLIRTPLKFENSGHNLLAVTRHPFDLCSGRLALSLVATTHDKLRNKCNCYQGNKAFITLILLETGFSCHSLTTPYPSHLTCTKHIAHRSANLRAILGYSPTGILLTNPGTSCVGSYHSFRPICRVRKTSSAYVLQRFLESQLAPLCSTRNFIFQFNFVKFVGEDCTSGCLHFHSFEKLFRKV
jgi:hypothetical protein